MNLYPLLRPLVMALDAEAAHRLTVWALKRMRPRKPAPDDPILATRVFGLDFPNPLGIAAGFDKHGEAPLQLAALGFGFVELGSITPRPQPGNPQPRLFRIPEAEAIINRMGFNNLGVDHLVEQVKKAKYDGILGINIGKNFDTPVENAADDYVHCLEKVYAHASYVTVNISSPNTQGLRSLQSGNALSDLLARLKETQVRLAREQGHYVPLLVKIAPDLQDDEILEMAEQFVDFRVDGVIATNTTVSRPGIESLRLSEEAGGLSGKPLKPLSTFTLARLSEALDGRVPLIGVGGILDGASAADKIAGGASLVQIYTGFIYRGPQLIADAVRAIGGLRE